MVLGRRVDLQAVGEVGLDGSVYLRELCHRRLQVLAPDTEDTLEQGRVDPLGLESLEERREHRQQNLVGFEVVREDRVLGGTQEQQ